MLFPSSLGSYLARITARMLQQSPPPGFVTSDMEIMARKEDPVASGGMTHPDVAPRLSALYRMTDGKFFVQGMVSEHFSAHTVC